MTDEASNVFIIRESYAKFDDRLLENFSYTIDDKNNLIIEADEIQWDFTSTVRRDERFLNTIREFSIKKRSTFLWFWRKIKKVNYVVGWYALKESKRKTFKTNNWLIIDETQIKE
jgi:hypothetical protein